MNQQQPSGLGNVNNFQVVKLHAGLGLTTSSGQFPTIEEQVELIETDNQSKEEPVGVASPDAPLEGGKLTDKDRNII